MAMARCFRTLLLVQLFAAVICVNETTLTKPYPCPSEVYCHGEMLHTMQMAEIHSDSKTYVDMKMKQPANETLKLFREFMSRTSNNPSKSDVEKFLNETFDPEGSEFETWIPSDWTPEPKFLQKIVDKNLQKFAKNLNNIWKQLGRKMKDDVRINSDLYSIIYVEHPVIVPGGRFREFYYWDSYWIIKGLLLSDMHSTAQGMLENFISIVERFGLIPNGGRIYYIMRSQPPMLIPMVDELIKTTKNYTWLKENLKTLEKEFDFWMTQRTVDVELEGVNYTLCRYNEQSSGPRPESYREDVRLGSAFRSDSDKEEFYSEVKSAAETGWDFSSRWFNKDASNKGNLSDLGTRSIIPVDLNALIYKNAKLLAEYNRKVGNESHADYYEKKAKQWMKAIEAVLWHEEVGSWLDYDIKYNVKRDFFYPSNVLPLWTECYDMAKKEKYVNGILKYLNSTGATDFLGGVPSSLYHTGEQWDYPNAWPPLQYFMIASLNKTGDPRAERLAFELSRKWVRGNYKAFVATNGMYEKYDANLPGEIGGGGEYKVQVGFGWSNGLVIDLLDKYADTMTEVDHFAPESHALHSGSGELTVSSTGQILTGFLAIIISLAAGFIG